MLISMEVILFVSQLDVRQQSIEDNHVFRIEALSTKGRNN
jgi:hypothetical protein